MDDVTLVARIDDTTTVYLSPVHDQTYAEYVNEDNLGGARGYFISRERGAQFEVLAKAASLEAAEELFDMLVGSGRRAQPA